METKTINKLMKYLLVFLIIFLIGCMNSYNYGDNLSFYDIRVKTIDGDYFDNYHKDILEKFDLRQLSYIDVLC